MISNLILSARLTVASIVVPDFSLIVTATWRRNLLPIVPTIEEE